MAGYDFVNFREVLLGCDLIGDCNYVVLYAGSTVDAAAPASALAVWVSRISAGATEGCSAPRTRSCGSDMIPGYEITAVREWRCNRTEISGAK